MFFCERKSLHTRGSDELPDRERINRAYVHTALRPLLPALLLGKKVDKLLRNVLTLFAKPPDFPSIRVLTTTRLQASSRFSSNTVSRYSGRDKPGPARPGQARPAASPSMQY